MVIYVCNICNYETTRKDNYNKHCLTKKHIENETKINIETIVFTCNKCDRNYKHKRSLTKHLKQCDIIKNIENNNTE